MQLNTDPDRLIPLRQHGEARTYGFFILIVTWCTIIKHLA